MESNLALLIADLEEGDRIARQVGFSCVFGTVRKVTDTEAEVFLDNDEVLTISDPIPDTWCKGLQLDTLQVGDTVSKLPPGEKRFYAEVVKYVKGEKVVLKSEKGTLTAFRGSGPVFTLERQFLYYTLEP